MEIVSLCQLPVAGILWSTEQRGWSLTVTCKATWAITPTGLVLADEQIPLFDVDQHWDGEPVCSVYAPGDLVPFKPRIDVMLVGHAYAPKGAPTTSLEARIAVGEIEKSLAVYGARVRDRDGEVGPTAGFKKVPLRFERAEGGPGTANPLGIPLDGEPDEDGSFVLPNIESLTHDDDEPEEPLAGFGPVAATWPIRSSKLGRHADSWKHGRWYEEPLPAELDLSYFNAAPEDQQLDVLDSRATITLENLLEDQQELTFELPPLRPQAYVELYTGEAELLTLRCDTIWIDSDRMLCTMTWRGQLRLADPDKAARCLVAVSETGETMSWLRVDRLRNRNGFAPIRPRGPDSLGSAIGLGLDSARKPPAAGRRLEVKAGGAVRKDPVVPIDAETLATAEVLSVPTESKDWLRPKSKPAPLNDRGDPIKKLIWFDPTCVRRLRAHPLWSDLEVAGLFVDDGGNATKQRGSIAERQTVFTVLDSGTPATAEDIEASVAAAMSRGGELDPPLIMSSGQLMLAFDELAVLRATITAVLPFLASDQNLGSHVADARELLGTSWLQSADGTAEELTLRIHDAFNGTARPLPPDYLNAQTRRIVVSERRYQRRLLFGRCWIRATFTPTGARVGIPTYLPDRLSDELPMFQRFDARILAEVDLREDQYESHPLAMRVLALAREVESPFSFAR